MTTPTKMVNVTTKDYVTGNSLGMLVMFLGDDDFADMWMDCLTSDEFEKFSTFDSKFTYEFAFDEYETIEGMVGEYVYDEEVITEIHFAITLKDFGWDFTEDIKQWKERRANA